jgi:hypothetical protein
MDTGAVMEFFKSLFVLVWSYNGVRMIVSHILINVVVALAAAQRTGDLCLSKLAEFLWKKLLPYVAAYFTVQLFGETAGLTWLGPACWTIIEATLIGNLTDNLSKLGLSMPKMFIQ